ncbi:MAG: hypothetical protein AAF699_08730 [Pseudomonadota bacterium]
MTLTSVVLPFYLAIDLFDMWLATRPIPGTDLSLLAYVPLILFYPLYQAAIIFFVASAVSDRRLGVNACLKLASRVWVPLFILSVISAPIIWIGLALLIIPGLFVIARLLFAQFYCIFDGMNPVDAIKASWNETMELQWTILGGLVLVVLACTMPILLLQQIVVSLGALNIVTAILISVLGAVLSTPPTVFAFRMYLAHQHKTSE